MRTVSQVSRPRPGCAGGSGSRGRGGGSGSSSRVPALPQQHHCKRPHASPLISLACALACCSDHGDADDRVPDGAGDAAGVGAAGALGCSLLALFQLHRGCLLCVQPGKGKGARLRGGGVGGGRAASADESACVEPHLLLPWPPSGAQGRVVFAGALVHSDVLHVHVVLGPKQEGRVCAREQGPPQKPV